MHIAGLMSYFLYHSKDEDTQMHAMCPGCIDREQAVGKTSSISGTSGGWWLLEELATLSATLFCFSVILSSTDPAVVVYCLSVDEAVFWS